MTTPPKAIGEPVYELSEGGSTLRVYPHEGATVEDFLTVEVNGPADSVRLSWSDVIELSDALRDLAGQGTFKQDALRVAEKRGAVKALRAEAERFRSAAIGPWSVRSLHALEIEDYAARLESGEVTLP